MLRDKKSREGTVPKYSSEGSHLSILRFSLYSQLRSVIFSQLSATSRYKATSKLPTFRVEIIIVDEEPGINKILPVNSLKRATACSLLSYSALIFSKF